MKTPIFDFVNAYAASNTGRMHMPGHKGMDFLGCEELDITEIQGADSLYEADGIIAQSERNAAGLFGSAATFYSTEGSSLCIRAMLYLLITLRRKGTSRTVFAARNAHRSFVYAAALLDFDVVWLTPEKECRHLCECVLAADDLERAFRDHPAPAAVFVTSPDYLGNLQDIRALSEVCHRYGAYLAVDNAHGAYLHFLPEKSHPLDLGADICCDSAHKTLPVLTGGAYLHLAGSLPAEFIESARSALALFGSTSPSYLILSSLDRCNALLEKDVSARIGAFLPLMEKTKQHLRERGYDIRPSDPFRITVRAGAGETGKLLAEKLRRHAIEPEFCDDDYLVLMLTPCNSERELLRLEKALDSSSAGEKEDFRAMILPERKTGIREAVLSPKEMLDAGDCLDRVCADPSVSCPPAVPIVMPGEVIGPEQMEQMEHYGVKKIACMKLR